LKTIRKKKQKGTYQEKELPAVDIDIKKSTTTFIYDFEEEKGISFTLPHESMLNISGRKLIGIKYGIVHYDDPEEEEEKGTPSGATSGFDMNQELQVRIKGKVGRKIDVNVDYDDTVRDKRDISVVYRGYKKGDIIDEYGTVAQKDEIVEEAAFGDINLSLPSTEFVSYNKNLFGISLKAKYNNFRFMGIGSRTKGITETKTFTGDTTFEKKDLRDAGYIRRRYYNLYFDSTQFNNDFPIKPGTVKVYIDNKQGKETGKIVESISAQKYNDPTAVVTSNYFEPLNSGVDYTIDYIKGIITFKRTIGTNHIIAVDYETKSGAKLSSLYGSGRYVILKDENESDAIAGTQEIKSYYSLGNTKVIKGTLGEDFIVKVLDADREDVSSFSDIYQKIEVDFDLGLLKFTDTKPFQGLYPPTEDIYGKTTVTSRYIIYVEYYHRIRTYLLRPNIVVDSERIVVDEKVLEKNKDYLIDYDTGFITFFNEEMIDRDTLIEVTYEYMPFGGQFQQTLVGARGEYEIKDRGHFGATVIYSGADKTSNIPNVRSTPASVSVIDSDMSLDIAPKNFPVRTIIKGEAAQSRRNPNVFDRAMVENMEGIKIEDTAPADKDIWQTAGNPNARPSTPIVLTNEDIELGDINPNVEDADMTVQVLNIDYNNLKSGEQTSIVYPISTVGIDYSKKESLEFWMYIDESTHINEPKIRIRYGGISEDADGNRGFQYGEERGEWDINDPKTEDLNRDSTLNKGEDIGWEYITSNSERVRIGADNGKIDTQDLDGDGVLDTDDGLGYEYTTLIDINGNNYTRADWEHGSWKKFIIPLEIGGAGGAESNWTSIKHLRITIDNDNASTIAGRIKLYNMSLVHNKWERGVITPAGSGTVSVSAVNNEDNPNYTDILEDIWEQDAYENLYKGILVDDEREQALLIEYTNMEKDADASTKYIFSRELDFANYRKFQFFVYGDNNNEEFYIQCGTDDSNYFEYTKDVNWSNKWQLCELSLKDENTDGVPDGFGTMQGSPRLNNIKQIKIGVRNKTSNSLSGRILVNEVIKKEGMAYKGEFGLSTKGWFNLSSYYKHIDHDFETITSGSTQEGIAGTSSITSGQEVDSWGSKLGFEKIRFLPVSAEVNRSRTVTPSSYDTNQSVQEEGLVEHRDGTLRGDLKIKYLPAVTGSYNLDVTGYENLDKEDETHTYAGKFNYRLPFRLLVLPEIVDGGYKRINSYTTFNEYTQLDKEIGEEDSLEVTDDYFAKTSFIFLRRLTISPSYNLRKVKMRKLLLFDFQGQENWYDTSNEQNAKVSASLRIFSWLNPNVSYSIKNAEEYNMEVSSATGRVDVNTKDISRTSNGEASITMDVRNLLRGFAPVSTLSLSGSYRIEDGDSWEHIDADLKTLDKLVIRDVSWLKVPGLEDVLEEDGTGRRLSFSSKDTMKLSGRWKPLSFLQLKGMLSLIPTLTTTVAVTDIDEEKEVTGTPSQTLTKIWPDVFAGMNRIENLFFLSRYMRDTDLSGKYKRKTIESINIAETLTDALSSTYRFKLFTLFDFSFSYSDEDLKEYNFVEQKISRHGYTTKYSGQVSIQFIAWRVTPKYENSRNQEWDIEDVITKMIFSDTYSIQTRADFNLPTTWKLPIIGAVIKFANRLVLDSEAKVIIQRTDINVEKDNKDTYSFTLKGDYDISNNLKMTLGSGFSRVDFIDRPEGNYYTFEINAEMSIVF
ncbi:hypothetical protein ACFL4O_03140, partial [bacterium]